MNYFLNLKSKKRLIFIAKIAVLICTVFTIFSSIFVNGLKPYYSFKDYSYRNNLSEGRNSSLEGFSSVRQGFIAKGNCFDSIDVYIGEIAGEVIRVSLSLADGKEIVSSQFSSQTVAANSWNKIPGMQTSKLKRGDEYFLTFSSENGLKPLITSAGNAPLILGICDADGKELNGRLAVGLQFTYSYLTYGRITELLFTILSALIFCIAMSFAVFKIEDLVSSFISTGEKKGYKSALYFSVSLLLLSNPIEEIRTEVTGFGRVIGAGIAANVDVSRRVKNFSQWLLLFSVSFVLFWLLSNDLFQRAKGDEDKRVISFLDDFFVIADCSLVLRLITFFNDEEGVAAVYSFTSCAFMLIALMSIAYMLLGFGKRLPAGKYAKYQFTGFCVSIPITIISSTELEKGRALTGWWALISLGIIIYCLLSKHRKKENVSDFTVDAIVSLASLLPLLTSLYIELIHILNQHEVFVAYPAKYYKITIFLYASVAVSVVFAGKHIRIFPTTLSGFFRPQKNAFKKKTIKAVYPWQPGIGKLERWAMPLFVFGVSCLSIQIPLSTTYNPDLFEAANSSILVSDLLHFGKIPIVEHYGGHMMTSVWEALVYGLVNRDYAGAIVSPYSEILRPFLVVLFYFLVREVWDEKAAPIVALLFPFYDFWSYYGMGMMTCLLAAAFIKKNTYFRAFLVWTAFIWCALYRLDLGFAFGMSLTVSLCVYIIAAKNRTALKQLSITLGIWAGTGISAWCILCFLKRINPIYRVIEFLLISLSNQNWAYPGIGNTANTLFSWSYIFVPVTVSIGLLLTIFSRKMRDRIGYGHWIILLIFGLSYFANFSRGLVRHSLAEMAIPRVIWCGYLFIALFVSAFRDNRKMFLPVFMFLILCSTLFVQDTNYASVSIAENAVVTPASIIESWEKGRFSEEDYEEKKYEQDLVLSDGGFVEKEDLLTDHYMTLWEKIRSDGVKVRRVELEESLEEYVDKYKIVITALLEEHETFVDFMNKSLLYSLLNREDPVYVTQSPLQLSGEFTQKEFVKEIAGVPLVLMPIDQDNYRMSNSLDGLTNAYRYYKVAEYIFQNYQPLCRYGNDFSVWCLKDRADEYKDRLVSFTDISLIDYGYDGPIAESAHIEDASNYISSLHNHIIGQLPRIWAEADKKKASNNSVVAVLSRDGNNFVFDPSAFSKEAGNYLLLSASYDGKDNGGLYYNDDEQTSASVVMGKYENGVFTEKCRYSMSVKEGTHDYLIRCSTDYYWYLNGINAVTIQSEDKLYDISMKILEGD